MHFLQKGDYPTTGVKYHVPGSCRHSRMCTFTPHKEQRSPRCHMLQVHPEELHRIIDNNLDSK